jgi:hypothetical protein
VKNDSGCAKKHNNYKVDYTYFYLVNQGGHREKVHPIGLSRDVPLDFFLGNGSLEQDGPLK